MNWLLFSYLISLGFKKVKQTSVVTTTLKINFYIGTDALLNFSVIDFMWQTSSRYTFFKRKKEKYLFFPLYRERFHFLGLIMLLTNFQSVVKKKKKNLSKCWYHFQTVFSAPQFTGNSWCSQTNPVFTHRPRVLEKKKIPYSFGELFLNVTLVEYLRELSNVTHILWTWGKHKLQFRRLL